MATGDIIFQDGTVLTPADIEKLLPLIQEKISSTAKDAGQYPVSDRLESTTSIPCFDASYNLVRVPVSQLKGNTGSTPEITFNVTSLPYGSTPTVDKTGTAENPTISIGLPKGKDGEKIVWRKTATGIEIKYEEEPDSSYKTLFTFFEVMPDVSDFSKEGIALLQRPATEAATEARNTMTTIQSEADAAIQSANDAAEVAQTAAENVQDGKTPVIEIGTVENGGTAAATLTPAGTDESGNPKSALNLVLPKGKDGEPPVVNYSVLTGQPGTEVQVSQEESGFTPEGNPIYNVTLTIPRGERGLPGLGNGNVYVDGTGLLAGEKYLFVPSATDSTEGTFVKYEDAPVDGKTYGRKDGKWSEVKVENALDISWLYDIVNNSESLTISQTQLDLIVNAYNNGFTAAYASDDIGGHIIPMYIVKETDPNVYHICLQMNAASENELGIAVNVFNIYSDTLTVELVNNAITLSTAGSGDKFLSDRGEYKPIAIPVHEAPKDGKIYGRKDGAWSETSLPIASPTILGGVKTGDNITNDKGTISITKDNVVSALDYTPVAPEAGKGLFSGKYDDLANKPNTISNPINIAANTDLDTLKEPGFYVCPTIAVAATLTHCPTTDAFAMIVVRNNGITQRIITHRIDASVRIYFRNADYTNAFGVWQREFSTADMPLASATYNGFMSTQDKVKLDRVRSYTNSSGLSSLGYDWENIYVNLSANASLSLVDSAFNTSNNGRSITIYVYCSASCTITIPTTGNYVSMCGSSYTCPAGKWVEFNLTCIEGKWHIAKLEQE